MTFDLRQRDGLIAAVRPNWSSAVGVEYSHKTSIFTARDGTETREAMRLRPRVALKFSTSLTRPALTRHQGDMVSGQEKVWAVRAEWDWVTTTEAQTTPSNTVKIGRVADWMLAGATVIVQTKTHEILAEILSVDDDEITLTEPSTIDYPAGTKVYLAFMSRAASTSDFEAVTSRVWQGAVRYEVDPGSNQKITRGLPRFSFGFKPMFLRQPNWRSSPRISFTQERNTFDPSVGLIDVDNPQTHDTIRMTYGFTGMSKDASDDVVGFFNNMRGRRGSFWVPSWQDTIEPSDTQLAGDNTVQIDGPEFREAYEDHGVLKSMIVFYSGNRYQANTITSMGGTTDTELTFEDDWAEEVTSATRMFWLVLSRFETDLLDVQWPTDKVADVQYALRSLPHDKEPDRVLPAGFVALYGDGYEVQTFGVKAWTDTSFNNLGTPLFSIAELGVTDEQLAAGDAVVFAKMIGHYQHGDPPADATASFKLGASFHTDVPTNRSSFQNGKVETLNTQGPDVDTEFGPFVVPVGTKWINFYAEFSENNTSVLTLTESTWGIGRPKVGSTAGTNAS